MKERKPVVVQNVAVANQLIAKGYKVIKIVPHADRDNKSAFMFEWEPSIYKDMKRR